MLVKNYSHPLDWNIGSLFAHDDFVWKILGICKELGIDSNIKYVFGSIPCKFQGGRIPARTATLENARKIIRRYNKEFGVSCRLTFSNALITKEDLEDELSNSLLQILEDSNKEFGVQNGLMVTLDILADYVRETYPSLELISSQVKPSVEVGFGDDRDTVDYYNKLFDKYNIVVVNPLKVQDYSFLEHVKYKDRVEFIVNHRCIPNCPLVKKHYITQMLISDKFLSDESCDKEKEELSEIHSWCESSRKKYPLLGTSMSEDDIDLLLSMGYKHFKVEGRDNEGSCFVRDLGDYVFNHHEFTRVSQAILGMVAV